jgi:hypothetical protein
MAIYVSQPQTRLDHMTVLRQSARGRPCMVRLIGVCNHDPSTTVLAHFRMAGISGMGLKGPDLLAAWACSACHDAIDRRAHTDIPREVVRLAHLEGMARTQFVWLTEGLVSVGEA